MTKKQRTFLEKVYCEKEGDIFNETMDSYSMKEVFKRGIVPVKKLTGRHLMKSINERYPIECPKCHLETKIKYTNGSIKCSLCNKVIL